MSGPGGFAPYPEAHHTPTTGENGSLTKAQDRSAATAAKNAEAAETAEARRVSLLALIKPMSGLDTIVFPPLHYAVSGIIPEGLGMLVGPPKVGKSALVAGVVLAIASGGVALGGVKVERHPVLYLALEDGDRRLQDRVHNLLDGAPIPDGLDYVTTPPGRQDIRDAIGAWLDQHPDGVVCLDTLGKVMPPTLPGEGAYERDYRVMGEFKALSDAHPGSTILIVHHDRKATSDDFVDAVSGTHGLAGAADFVIVVDRKRNEATALLKVTGRDVRETEYAADYNYPKWTLHADSLAAAESAAASVRATAGLGTRTAEIIAYVLAAAHPVAPKEAAEALGLEDNNDVGHRLRLAAKAGRIVQASRGLYAAPPSTPPLGDPLVEVGEVAETSSAFSTPP